MVAGLPNGILTGPCGYGGVEWPYNIQLY